MKEAVLALALLISGSAFATVMELDDSTTNKVLEVYEEMREEEVITGSDNDWIHDFEQDSLGSEMDHLSGLKSANATYGEM